MQSVVLLIVLVVLLPFNPFVCLSFSLSPKLCVFLSLQYSRHHLCQLFSKILLKFNVKVICSKWHYNVLAFIYVKCIAVTTVTEVKVQLSQRWNKFLSVMNYDCPGYVWKGPFICKCKDDLCSSYHINQCM